MTANNTDVLLIEVGARAFAFSLADVRYVAAMSPEFRHKGAGREEYFLFEGIPVSYISLWDRLGIASSYTEYEGLLDMLPQRRQDHIDWMAALEDSIHTGRPFAKARDHRECAFGKWYYAYRTHDRRLSLLLEQFERPHAQIHALADELLAMAHAGNIHEAALAFNKARDNTLSNLLHLFDSTRNLVVELQRRVVVILSDGTDTYAFGADGVRDIASLAAEAVKGSESPRTGSQTMAARALLVLEDRSIAPLLDWRSLA